MSRISNQKGFTVIELMIATSIFSVMLTIVSVMMVNIGNLYYKGVNQSRIQDSMRSISDDISSHLELSSSYTTGTGAAGVQSLCVGSTRYTYVLGQKIGTDTGNSRHVLWRDTIIEGGGGGLPCPAGDVNMSAAVPTPTGTELIGANSRLTSFTITPGNPVGIALSGAYGDVDLSSAATGYDVKCLDGAAKAYCATAKLTAATVNRIR